MKKKAKDPRRKARPTKRKGGVKKMIKKAKDPVKPQEEEIELDEEVAAEPDTEPDVAVADGCIAPVNGKPCGKPKAIGQSYVCSVHVRAN